jgi:hypothetical protein
LEVITPAFIPIPDIPQVTQNDTNDQDNIANQECTASLTALVFLNHSRELQTKPELPSPPVPIIKKA